MAKRLLQGLCIGVVAALVALALRQAGWLDLLESTPWSWRVRYFAPRQAPAPQVKVLLLDQDGLDWGKRTLGLAWPWPREAYGPILDFCRRGGATAVAVDVLFTEPSSYSVEDDQALGAAVAANGRCVGAVFLGDHSGETTAWPTNWTCRVPQPASVAAALAAAPAVRQARRCALPVGDVATNAAALANVSDAPDADGVFRRSALYSVFDGRVVPSLGLAAYLVAADAPSWTLDAQGFRLGGRRVPLDAHGRMILRFKGRTGRHETFGVSHVIQSELALREGGKPAIDPSVLSNAYVFVGISAPGLLDQRPTPVSRVYPGVEVHATVLDNLLTWGMLRDAPEATVVPVTVLLALLAACAGVLARRARQSVLVFVVLLPLPVLLAFGAYARGVWWPLVGTELAVLLALVGAVVANFATEGRQRLFLKNAFRHYLGPEVIEQIIADPSRLALGGEKRELTVFFSDIEKFSSFSERLDPTALTALLNAYLSEMGAIIKDEGGYLDKYIGDAIVAFWNAPLPQPDHAERACRAAVRCQRMLAARGAEFARMAGGMPVRTRIGLNTGDVVVGNMGSRERFNYTILGDAANLASRLEGANKAFGTYLMASETTWRAAGGTLLGRELACLRVMGRHAPVGVFEVAGFAGDPRPAVWELFAEGLRHFQAGRLDDALACFERNPDDPASRSYARRCGELRQQPAPAAPVVWELHEK